MCSNAGAALSVGHGGVQQSFDFWQLGGRSAPTVCWAAVLNKGSSASLAPFDGGLCLVLRYGIYTEAGEVMAHS